MNGIDTTPPVLALLLAGAAFGFAGARMFAAAVNVASFLFFGLVAWLGTATFTPAGPDMALALGLGAGVVAVVLFRSLVTTSLIVSGIAFGALVGQILQPMGLAPAGQGESTSWVVALAAVGGVLALVRRQAIVALVTATGGSGMITLAGAHLAGAIRLSRLADPSAIPTDLQPGLALATLVLGCLAAIVQLRRL